MGSILNAMRTASAMCVLAMLAMGGAEAQTRRPVPARARSVTEPVTVQCAHLLGEGVGTKRSFCDIRTGMDPALGAVIRLPSRQGVATLSFDLHNRHTFSAELVESGRGYARATATIGVLTMDGRLLTRALITTEFRREEDLFDRVAAGDGMPGVKAVAPVGAETIVVEIPANVDAVSLLGEKLVVAAAGRSETVTAPGHAVATISDVRLQYRPRRGRR